ncbi:MAG: FtsX-like permease family protein [Chitinophagaceae bacterium]
MEDQAIISKRKLTISWLFIMAWRDSRKNRPRLFLFISSIIFGIAALVAIDTFSYNLRKDINEQAASLTGADLTISGNRSKEGSVLSLLDSLGNKRSQELVLPAMVYFPSTQKTRLVQVRALGGEYPYYGRIETTPVVAGSSFRKGKLALVDQTLMLLLGVKAGDSVKLGKTMFVVAGSLDKAPGQVALASGIAPIVYIPYQYLAETGFSQTGNQVNHSFYYKFDHAADLDKVVKDIAPRLDKAGMNYETIEMRKHSTTRAFGDLSRFLSLVGFIALLLGCVGVASAIHIYIREKILSIAILRCLGVKSYEAFLIYLIQIACIGLTGSVCGAVLGIFVQHILPFIFSEFIPVSITTDISWTSIWQGIILGLVISMLFALLSLIAIRKISPLNVFRISFENINLLRDPFRWLVYLSILLFILLFSKAQLGDWTGSIAFSVAILVAFFLLSLSARWLIYAVRLFVKSSWTYIWRQGFANLYRPNNQTQTLMVSVGLGTAFICTLFFIQDLLIKQVNTVSGGNANMILVNIEKKQITGIDSLAGQFHLPVLQKIPIVTLRIRAINDKTAEDIATDTVAGPLEWLLKNEFRVSYSDTLSVNEKIVAGKWTGHADTTQEVPVSFQDRFARGNGLKVGDHLVFDIQGKAIHTTITSLREVDWNKLQSSFPIKFPDGVLEDLPQTFSIITKVPSKQISAEFQRSMVKLFPNVFIVDMGLVISVLDDILDKLTGIIRFMALFSIVTGFVVLIASVRISKYQRLQESVLLRTLGASKSKILAITTIEYFFLGTLSVTTGIIIAATGSWLLAKYGFKIPFYVNFIPVTWLFLTITGLTILIGFLNSRGILNKPPLEVLRKDL